MSSEQPVSLKGVALITGAYSAIGHAIARRLASDGYDVALCDTNEDDLKKLKDEISQGYSGRRFHAVVADVSIEEQVKKMIDDVVSTLGSLDVMVANASIAKRGLISETTAEDLDAVLAVNVRGTFFCYKYAAERMVSSQVKGRIIGASSLGGKRGFADWSAYCASKFAIRGLTQSAAMEYGKEGITVNAYALGPFMADLFETPQENIHPDFLDLLKKTAAIEGGGKEEDIASLVAFLASPESGYITGQTISLDGGIHFD